MRSTPTIGAAKQHEGMLTNMNTPSVCKYVLMRHASLLYTCLSSHMNVDVPSLAKKEKLYKI